MNANEDSGAVSLLALDALDVYDIFTSVALNNFASLLTLVVASDNLIMIINWKEEDDDDDEIFI